VVKSAGRISESPLSPADANVIVVADSDAESLALLRRVAPHLGCDLIAVSSGRDALERAADTSCRLILADIDLPQLSGYELCQQIRADRRTQGIPVVLLSNRGQVPDQILGRQAGADDYLCKPFNEADLLERLRALLKRERRPAPVSFDPPPEEAEPVDEPLEAPTPVPEPPTAPAPAPEPPEAPAPAPEPPEAAAPSVDIEAKLRREAEQLYDACGQVVRENLELARDEAPIHIAQVEALARDLVKGLGAGNHLLLMALDARRPFSLPRHFTNDAIFCVKIATGLGYEPDGLIRAAILGLVHDIGMSRVTPGLILKRGKLTRSELQEVREHTRYGHEIVLALGERYRWLAEAVYQEHEREQGQGYPRGLQGDQIVESAKILGVADVYEALSHPRSFRKTFIAFEALHVVVQMRETFFDPRVVRGLMNEISVFPIDSYVALNTGEIGRVQESNQQNLMRPIVAIRYDTDGRRLEKERLINLAANPLLYVQKPLYEDELPDATPGGSPVAVSG